MKTGRRKRRGYRWGQRWKNRRPDGSYVTKGDNWTASRSQTCPHCGKRYYWFRMPTSREDVLWQLKQEADRGDIPCVTLRTLLGRCHEIKMRAWAAHIQLCGGWEMETDENGVPDKYDLDEYYRLEANAGHFVTKDRRRRKRKPKAAKDKK